MNEEKFKNIFSETDFTLKLEGTFGIPELCEMVDFLKMKKAETVETVFV